ncbi:sulfurtransferase-like selenium metabolism protein YedF, partial [uncultured Cetobacterium sp.]
MIKIDAIGQICPMPIIMTKNALKEISEGTIEISVDNKISKENIEKFAHEMNFHYLTEEKDNLFFIQITKTLTNKVENKKSNDTVIVIDSDKMGQGDDALGETLMKGFIYTLTEIEELPKAILFYNRGVFLTSLIKSSVKDL